MLRRAMTRWLVRTVASFVGFAALAVFFVVMKMYGLKDPKRERMREGIEASAAVRQDLGRECTLSVEPAPGYEDQVVVTVKYPDPPADQNARRELVRNTNMTVRRVVHHVRELNIVFDDAPEAIPSWDGGVAVAGAPQTAGYNAPVPIPGTSEPTKIAAVPLPSLKADAGTAVKAAPKGQKTGTVTLVTFPEADVFRGKDRLGHTPLFNAELPVGTHLLTLVGADGVKRKLSVPVKLGKNKPLKMNLDDLPVR